MPKAVVDLLSVRDEPDYVVKLDECFDVISGNRDEDNAESFDLCLSAYSGRLAPGKCNHFDYGNREFFITQTSEVLDQVLGRLVIGVLAERVRLHEGGRTPRVTLAEGFDNLFVNIGNVTVTPSRNVAPRRKLKCYLEKSHSQLKNSSYSSSGLSRVLDEVESVLESL